jgi:hypothetical protein
MDVERFKEGGMSGELVNSDGDIAFKPDPLPPEISIEGELLDVFTRATSNVGQLSGIGRRVDNPSMLISPFIYKEAVVSSEIEGTRVTLSDVYEYEAGREDGGGPSRNELKEVHNYVRAVFQGIEEMDGGIDLDLVRTNNPERFEIPRCTSEAAGPKHGSCRPRPLSSHTPCRTWRRTCRREERTSRSSTSGWPTTSSRRFIPSGTETDGWGGSSSC